MNDTAQLRRWIYHLIILIALGIACGRIASAQRIYEPAFHRDPAKEGDRRPVWPATRPDAMPMFGSNDRARWATMRALVHDRTYVIGKREPKLVYVSAGTMFAATDPLQAAVLAQAGYDVRTDASNPTSHTGILFKSGVKEHGWATIDRVMNPNTLEFYSSKPPLLSTILAGVYWFLFHAFGWSLSENPNTVVRTMLILVNALPFAGYLWLLTKMAERWGRTDWGRLYVVAAGAFGTTVTPFLITLNNHTIATFSVMAAWWSILEIWRAIFLPSPPGRGAGGEGEYPTTSDSSADPAGIRPGPPLSPVEGRKTPWLHFVSAGFFSAFAVANEMPALAFAAAAFVLLVWWCPARTLAIFVPAALVPVVGFFGTNYLAIGQLRPAQSEFGSVWYSYEGSHWKPPPEGTKKFGIDWAKHHESRAEYAMHMLVGHHGLFTLTPIWILAFVGMFAACWRWRDLWRQALFRSGPFPSAAEGDVLPWFVLPVGLALSVVVVGFFLLKSDNYGGFTNGLRWLMWLTPIWLTCLVPSADRLAASCWGRWGGGLLLTISVFSASYQLWSPWRHPWVFDLLIELGWPGY